MNIRYSVRNGKGSRRSWSWLGVDLVNQVRLEAYFLAEWERSTTVNYCKGKGDSLERANYRGLNRSDSDNSWDNYWKGYKTRGGYWTLFLF